MTVISESVSSSIISNAPPDSSVSTNAVTTPKLKAKFTHTAIGRQISFNNTSIGSRITYSWDFGDGASSTSRHPTRTYAVDGDYEVALTITTSTGSSDTIVQTIAAEAIPNAGFTWSANAREITFTNTSTGRNKTYAWTFGEDAAFPGQPTFVSTETNPVYTYQGDGTYTVTLVVTNAGGSNTFTEDIGVTFEEPGPLAASFTYTQNQRYIEFTDTSVGDIQTWTWQFGSDDGGSSQQHPTHEFSYSDGHIVTLTVSDGVNESVTDQTIEAWLAPVADFTYEVDTQFNPDEPVLHIVNTSTIDGGRNDLHTFDWDFGDGGTDTVFDPGNHEYVAHGVYDVSLVINGPGGTDTKTIQIDTQVEGSPPPEAMFTYEIDGLTVYLTNTSTGTINSYNWEFGDGGSTSDQDPISHTYAEPGFYTIYLDVFYDGGSDTHFEDIEIIG